MNATREIFPTLRLAPDLCPDLIVILLVCAVVCVYRFWRAARAGRTGRKQRSMVRRGRAIWLAATTPPEVLFSWVAIGATLAANKHWGFSVRYLTMAVPFLFLLVAWGLCRAARKRRLAQVILLCLIAFNLLNRNGAYFPSLASDRLVWNLNFEKNWERSHEYLGFHRANLEVASLLERFHHDETIVATYPYTHFLGLPRLGYVKRPLHGYCFEIGHGLPTFKNVRQWQAPGSGDPIFLGDRFGRFSFPAAERGDEILFSDRLVPPLAAYKKRWQDTPAQALAEVERWCQDRDWPGDWFSKQVITRCECMTRLGLASHAIEEYRAATLSGLVSAEVWLRLARLLREQGQPAEAAEELIRFLEMNPDDVSAHDLLATIQMEQGQAGKAIARLRALAVRSASSKEARAVLVNALVKTGRPFEAKIWLEELLRLDPHDGNAWLQLGIICFSRQDAPMASYCLSQALAQPLSPANAELARQYLARVHDEL